MGLHVDLDNRIRRINKRMADIAKYGSATDAYQELSRAMVFTIQELDNDLQLGGDKSAGIMKAVMSTGSEKYTPLPQIRRIKELEKIDPYKLDEILARVESIEGIGKETRAIRAKLRAEGKEPTDRAVYHQLREKYEENVEYMDKVRTLYYEVLHNEEHFLWEETNFVFDAYVGRGKNTREGVAHVNRLYTQHIMWKEGEYDPIRDDYSWEKPEYK